MKTITTISPIEIFDTFATSGNATFFKVKLFEHDIKEIKNAIKVLKENTRFNRIALRFDAIPQTLDENYKPVEWEFEMDSVELTIYNDGQVYLTGYIGDIRFESKPLSLDKPEVYVYNLQDIEMNRYIGNNRIRFVSFEPVMEYIRTGKIFGAGMVDWIIVGAMSGQHKPRTKIKWIYAITSNAKNNEIPVFVKQIEMDGKIIKDIEQFPEALQYREFPNHEFINHLKQKQ